MKIKTTTLDKIAALLLFFLLTLATVCFGIKRSSSDSLLQKQLTTVTQYKLVSFTAKQIESKKYLNWSVISTHGNFYFVLERSTDGQDYTVIDLKKGFVSPKGQKLQYSYIDSGVSAAEKFYYRIRLLEIQAVEGESKKAILSKDDLFAGNDLAIISVNNQQNIKP